MHAASRYGACPKLDAIVLLVQKEVAQRLAAEPGTHPYGALSVLVQFWCSVEIISVVSRRVFLPRPKVDSAIVRLRPRGSPAVPVSDEQFFFKVVRAAFGQRRKTLLNALQSLPGVRLGRTQLEQAILDAGINPQQRGETLSIQQFANLADSIAKRTAQNE
jgi:16S rRNA (adenine1518-N6/adenine1519-N6)-dimethyltransferase